MYQILKKTHAQLFWITWALRIKNLSLFVDHFALHTTKYWNVQDNFVVPVPVHTTRWEIVYLL